MMLDEPANGLDPAGIRELRGRLQQLAHDHNVTIFLSSHVLNEVEQVADCIGIINRGQLLFQGKLQAMFGDALTLTNEHKVWWSYVGHFLHTPGYVYAYAFGNLLALSVYHRYLEVGPSFVDKYIDFLAAGGSTRPDELVRRLGMDITDPGFWDAGLKILDGMVTEVESLA